MTFINILVQCPRQDQTQLIGRQNFERLPLEHTSLEKAKNPEKVADGTIKELNKILECPKHRNEGILCLVSAKPVQCVCGYHVS